MTTRTLVILAGVLVALALLATLGGRSDAPPSRNGEPLLPELATTLGMIDRVRVVGPGGAASTTLERLPDHWAVAEKQGYPADIGKIRDALRGLADARVVEEMTSNPAYYDRLGVADVDSSEARGVELTAFAADATRAAVIIGDAAGTGQHYVRKSGDPVSYLVDVGLDVSAEPSAWLDPLIVDIPSTRIESVSIEHPDGETLRIFKTSAEQTNFEVDGVPAGRELSYPGVANVIGNTLRDLRLEDVRRAAEPGAGASDAGEDDAAARAARATEVGTTAAFRTFDGLVVNATTIERDGESWVRFDARAETLPTLAAESGEASGDVDGAVASDTEDSAAAESGDGSVRDSAAEEAQSIRARLAGWEYKLPAYQVGQLTRRLDDLLRADEDDEDN